MSKRQLTGGEVLAAVEGMAPDNRRLFDVYLSGWLLAAARAGNGGALREVADALQGFTGGRLTAPGPARPPAAEEPGSQGL